MQGTMLGTLECVLCRQTEHFLYIIIDIHERRLLKRHQQDMAVGHCSRCVHCAQFYIKISYDDILYHQSRVLST